MHYPIQRLLYSLLTLLLINSITFGQSNRSTKAPEVQSFALNPDLKGMGENSVNLYSGDVNLPVSLVTLPGRRGLNVNVTASYNSNIQDKEDVWNKEAPTGILGLGWSMGYDKIVVDHKQTGNRHDDDFYLMTGGNSIELIQTGYEGNGKVYETKPYKFWEIIYYPSDERWEITKEGGKKYIFGGGLSYGSDGNKGSIGNSVQWGVKWGNWIGASGRTQGQQQHAIAWNLSEMRDRWGNEVTYTYDAVVEEVGRVGNPDYETGLQHTKASYLSEITNPEGKTVRFVYGEKESSGSLKEYYDPHTQPVPEEDIGVSISGPTMLVEGENGTWTASVEAGTSPYQYSWRYRSCSTSTCSGESWNTGGSGSSFTVYGQEGDNYLEIGVSVQDSEGAEGYDSRLVILQPDPDGGGCSGTTGGITTQKIEPCEFESTSTSSGTMMSMSGQTSFEPQSPAGTVTENSSYREPDAYQEKYETRYLDYVLVKNESDEELFTVDMTYGFNNDGQDKPPKRLLTSIKHIMPSGKSLPEMEFSYNSDSHSVHPSALKTVTYPTGSEVTYTYSEQTIGNSSREKFVSVPSGYDDPRVFVARDYVVTTWRKESSLWVKVYTWDGEWLEHKELVLGDAGKLVNGKQNFEVFLGEDYFILIDRFYEDTSSKKVYSFRKNIASPGDWHYEEDYLATSQFKPTVQVVTGENFFTIVDIGSGKLNRFVWNGSNWDRSSVSSIRQSGADPHFFIGGANNYFVFDNEDASGPDQLAVHFLDETQNWQTKNINTAVTQFESDIDSGGERNHIWADNSHFTIMAKDTWESIFRLKEDYSLKNAYNIGSIKDSNPVFNVANSIISHAQKSNSTHAPRIYRFDGITWHDANSYLDNLTYSVGNDLLVKREGYYSNGTGSYISYDANSSTWTGSQSLSGPSDRTFPEVGNDFFIFGETIHYLNNSGSRSTLGSISQPSGYKVDYKTLRAGVDFLAYGIYEETGSNSFSPYGSYIYPTKNGNLVSSGPIFLSEYAFDDRGVQRSNMIGGKTIVTRSPNASLDNSTNPWVKLYRFVDEKIENKQKDYPVTSIDVDNGYQVQSIYFDYDVPSATVDPTGSLAQYNKVTVEKGTGEGQTDHYFYNGLSSSDPDLTEPYTSSPAGYEGLLKGLHYTKKVKSSAGITVSETKNYWERNTIDIENAGGKIAESTWIRQHKTETIADGLKTTISKTFDMDTGQPTQVTTFGDDGDTRRKLFTYWWEKYDADRSENLLTPVVQTEKQVNNITTALSVTTWREWGNGWVPHKSYRWKGSGSSVFDFANWSGSGEPNSNWLKTKEIDSWDLSGNIFQSTNAEGVSTAYKWVDNATKLGATFNNAEGLETWLVNMETFQNTSYGDLANKLSIYDNGNGTITYSRASDHYYSSSQRVEIDNLTDSGAGVSFDLGNPTASEKYIVEFDYKVTEGQLDFHSYRPGSGWKTWFSSGVTGKWKRARIDWEAPDNGKMYFRAPYNGSGANNVTFYLDNIRVYPDDALAKSYSYDAKTGKTESVVNEDNVTTHYLYDEMQRSGSVLDHKGRVLSQKGYFYSRSRNNDAFNVSDPNFTSEITYVDEDGFSDFSSSDGWTVDPEDDITFGVYKGGELTVRIGTNGNWNNIRKSAGNGDVLARADFYPDNTTGGSPHVLFFNGGGDRFAVHYKPTSDKFRIQYQFDGGSFQYSSLLPLDAPPNAWYTVEIVKNTNGVCTAWVYPKGSTRSEENSYSLSGYPGNWNPTIRSSTKDDYFYLANFYSGSYSESKQFANGLGQTLQTQTWNGAGGEYIVSHTQYDEMGRKWKSWMPYVYNTGGSYDTNFSSHADSYYGTGSTRLYSEKLYESDPMSRVSKINPPDNGTSGITRDYGTTSINGQQFAYTDETGLDGITNRTLRNPHVNKSRSISAYGSSNSVTSEKVADPVTRTTETRPPHYFDPPGSSSASDWISTSEKDFLGRTIKVQTPDAGTVENKYDELGKLRFTQDANQAASGLVGFTRYDGLGRSIASGEAVADFASLNGTQSYGFETDQTTQIQATAYDDKPSSGSFPWSLFGSELSGTNLSNTYGKVSAAAFRTTGKSEAGSTLEGETITGSSTIETAGALVVGPDYTVESNGNVTLRSGSRITLKPGFHAKSGSDFYASIDPGLSTGSNSTDWQLTLHSFDELGQMATKYIFTQDKPELDTRIDYTYNHLGEVVKQHVEVGGEHLYHFYDYDNKGQLVKVFTNTSDSKPTNPEVTYTYNESGQLVDENIYGQTKADINYSYDLKGRLDQLSNGDNSFSEDISYNDDGTIQSISFDNTAASYSYTYSYDDLGRLKSANYSAGTTEFDVNNVTYDKHGNIKSLERYFDPSLVDDVSYDHIVGTNKLGSVSDEVASTGYDWDVEDASFTYDANGNMKTNTGRGVENIGYDTRNLPLSMELDNDLQTIYRYNSEGWRTLKKVEDNGTTSVEEHYIMDGGTVLAVTDANGNIKHWNLYGNGLIGRLEDTGTKKYYVRDHLGSTRQVINDSGNRLEYYDYYPFGLVLRSDVVGQETKETFTGKERDPATGYYYFGSRYYDAALAGWGTTDPAGQFASPYVYAGNPVSYVDPDGESFVGAVLLGIKIASAAMAAHNIYRGYSQGGLNGGIQALMGTAAGYIASAGVSSSGLFSFGNSFGGAVASGAVQGSISGGGVTAMYGGNFFEGALQGGLNGAATSGGQWLALQGAMSIDASIAANNSKFSSGEALGSDEVLHKIAKDEFSAEVGGKGLAKLTGQEVPKGHRLTESGSFRKKQSWVERLFGVNPGASAEGHTYYIGNRQSEVYLAPSAYRSYRRLYMVLGHELVHVQHYYMGLWEKHRSYFNKRSEFGAYTWNVNAAKAKGWSRFSKAYQGYINNNLSSGYHHEDFLWNEWY